MKLQHFILTRFSYRYPTSARWMFLAESDPLDPVRLEFRFALFEGICIPSVLSQTLQDFDWMIIIDKDLPPSFIERLKKLISVRKRTHLYVFDPTCDLGRLNWLEPYIAKDSEYVMTTTLDDDDSLPITYMEALRHHVAPLLGEVPFKLLGTKNVLEWDLFFSKENRLGTVAPFHRHRMILAPGFSLLCRYPAYNFTVFAIRHVWAERIFDGSASAGEWSGTRKEFEATAAKNEDSPKWSNDYLVFEMGKVCGPALLVNHIYNDQAPRLIEGKKARKKVTGPDSFPENRLNWDSVRANHKLFKASLENYTKILHRIFLQLQTSQSPIHRKVVYFFKTTASALKAYTKEL